MRLMTNGGSLPRPRGRGRPIYPLRTMSIGQFFFLPGTGRGKNFSSYLAHRGKVMGKKFSYRRLEMKRDPTSKLWVASAPGDPDGVPGVAVYRVA